MSRRSNSGNAHILPLARRTVASPRRGPIHYNQLGRTTVCEATPYPKIERTSLGLRIMPLVCIDSTQAGKLSFASSIAQIVAGANVGGLDGPPTEGTRAGAPGRVDDSSTAARDE